MAKPLHVSKKLIWHQILWIKWPQMIRKGIYVIRKKTTVRDFNGLQRLSGNTMLFILPAVIDVLTLLNTASHSVANLVWHEQNSLQNILLNQTEIPEEWRTF